MSGYDNQFDSDEGDTSEDNTGRGLRKQLEQALAELAEVKKVQQKASATDVLKNAGIDPALADLVPKDTDPAEWVAQYGPLLGARPKTLETEEQAPAGEIQEPPEEDIAVTAEREAREAMEGAASSGSSSVYSTDVIERMNKIDNEADLLKFINSNGAM